MIPDECMEWYQYHNGVVFKKFTKYNFPVTDMNIDVRDEMSKSAKMEPFSS